MQVTTIYDLPYDVIKIILRIVIVGPNVASYFCVSKTFNDILNIMAKKYVKPDKFCCIVCYRYDCDRFKLINGVKSWTNKYNTKIVFDNVCEICLIYARQHTCSECHIKFMSTYLGKPEKTLCENCYDNKQKSTLVVVVKQHFLPHSAVTRHICIDCNCVLKASYYDFITYKSKTICSDCYCKIGNKSIVLPNGFPYEINTYCPPK